MPRHAHGRGTLINMGALINKNCRCQQLAIKEHVLIFLHIQSNYQDITLPKSRNQHAIFILRTAGRYGLLFAAFSEYISISPEGGMECTQLFQVILFKKNE